MIKDLYIYIIKLIKTADIKIFCYLCNRNKLLLNSKSCIYLMKKLILLIALFSSITTMAQDVIVKKDGSTILAKVTKIGDKEVEYKKYNSKSDRLYSISVSELMAINYEDGEREDFSNSSKSSENEDADPKEIKIGPATNNSQLLNLYAKDYHLSPLYKIKDKDREKITKSAVCFLSFTETSIISNDEIELSLVPDTNDNPGNSMVINNLYFRFNIVLYNKTNSIIYVDLANCFRTENNRTSYCYYSNNIITENLGNVSGGSFNLGGITNAAGIGGVAGSLANATTIGKSTMNSVSKTHIKQRILQIPPKGRLAISSFDYVTIKKGNLVNIGKYELSDKGEEFYFSIPLYGMDPSLAKTFQLENRNLTLNNLELRIGEEKKFNTDNSPYKANYHIVYSTKENFKTYSVLSPTLYINKIIGIKKGPIIPKYTSSNSLQEFIDGFNVFTVSGPVSLDM